jgi:hypothetical protein
MLLKCFWRLVFIAFFCLFDGAKVVLYRVPVKVRFGNYFYFTFKALIINLLKTKTASKNNLETVFCWVEKDPSV